MPVQSVAVPAVGLIYWVILAFLPIFAVGNLAFPFVMGTGSEGVGLPVDNINSGGDDARRDYPCALADGMWEVVSAVQPVRDPARGGRPLVYGHRLVIDTILYVLVSGCAWRLVPHDLAPWDAAYRWFRCWSRHGVWDDIHQALRDRVRRAEGRDVAPSAGCVRSTRTSG